MSGRVVGIFIHVVVVTPGWVVCIFRGAVRTVVVSAAAHLIFLAASIIALCIAVGHRWTIVATVLGTVVELVLVVLIVVIVEVGAYVTFLTKFKQLIMKITLPFWPATVISSASPDMMAVVVIVTLTAIVGVVVDGRVGIDVDGCNIPSL